MNSFKGTLNLKISLYKLWPLVDFWNLIFFYNLYLNICTAGVIIRREKGKLILNAIKKYKNNTLKIISV